MVEAAKFGTLNTNQMIVADTFNAPPAKIGNTNWREGSTNRLAASKAVTQKVLTHVIADATTVTNQDVIIYVSDSAATIKDFYIRTVDAPTGGDKTYSCDLKIYADGSGSGSTVLSSTVAAGADDTKVDATISSASVIADYALRASVTVTGSTGTQGLGLILVLTMEETHA